MSGSLEGRKQAIVVSKDTMACLRKWLAYELKPKARNIILSKMNNVKHNNSLIRM